MILKRCFLLLGLSFSAPLFAQHCGMDGVYMFSIKVTDSTGVPIDNLKITLLDSLGNTYTKKKETYYFIDRTNKLSQNDTILFSRNLSGIGKNESNTTRRILKLAGPNYYLLFNGNFTKYSNSCWIKIEDPSKAYYSASYQVYSESAMNLCLSVSEEENIGKTMTFTLRKRMGYSFRALKILEVISDQKKIEDLEKSSEHSGYGAFFINRYVNKENTNTYALFEKKDTKCIAYELAYFDFLNDELFKDNVYLTFTNGYNSGGGGHSESEAYFMIVNLKKLTVLTVKSLSYSEAWDPHGSGDSNSEITKCESTISFEDNILNVKRTCSENFETDNEEECIPSGIYEIVGEKLVKIK